MAVKSRRVRHRSKLIGTGAIALGLASLFVFASRTDALLPWRQCGGNVKWGHPNVTWVNVGYGYGGSAVSAANSWNGGTSNVDFAETYPGTYPDITELRIQHFPTNNSGTFFAPACSGGIWTGSGRIEVDLDAGTGAYRVQGTSAHELGHALGMSDNWLTFNCTSGSPGYYSIMHGSAAKFGGYCPINTPQPQDFGSVNEVYNGK